MNNCNTATKFSIVESNIWGWRQQKQKLINANTTQKSFSGPKNGNFQATKQWTVEFVYPHKKLEGWSHVKQLNIKHGNCQIINHVASVQGQLGLTCVIERNRFSLCRTSLCQKLPADFVEIPAVFQWHVTGLQIMNNYTHSKTGNTDETPVYFSMPSNDGVNDTGQNTWW